MSKYIQRFVWFPKELFRINYGPAIALRDRAVKRTGTFDLETEAGMVKPKALDPTTYKAPNGASMRPNTPMQKTLVRRAKGSNVTIYVVPQGTVLPDGLTLIHERGDHYSLQASEEMSLEELNTKITLLLNAPGQALTIEQWLQKYPKPTEHC